MSAASSDHGLARLLTDARRTLVRARVIQSLLLAIAVLGLSLGSGGLSHLFGASPGLTSLTEIVVAALGLSAVALWSWPKLRSVKSDVGVARWLDAHCDAAFTGLESAVELLRDRGEFGESPELATAAARRTVQAARREDRVKVAAKTLAKRTQRFMLAPAGAAAFILLLGLISPGAIGGALTALTAMDEIDEALERLPPEPRLGDIHLTLRYPAYTQRAPRSFVSPSGKVLALAGTEVEIETLARTEVRQASLLINNGRDSEDGTAQRIAVHVDGRALRTKLVVNRGGRYRFRLTDSTGEVREERRGHEIELEIDEPPQVSLLEPTESPLEVNERDRISLMFRARDDFALGDTEVYWRVLGTTREGRVRLTSASSGKKRFSGSAQLDLAQLDLKPGDRVAYTLEVKDNDTVSGPKVGTSATQELRIYSERGHHRQVLALQQQSLDEMVHILGDNLEYAFENVTETPVYKSLLGRAQAIVQRAKLADELLRTTVAAIRKDPLGRNQVADAFNEARKELRSDTRRKARAVKDADRHFTKAKKPNKARASRVKRHQDGMIKRLEKNVVYLADLLNDQRLIDAQALAKDLRQEQENLRKALQEYKDAPTDEKRALIAQAIKDIKRRMQEIMAELSQLKTSIPQDFVNQDALDTKDTQEQLDEMQKKLEEGDLDAAMEALDKMLAQTERMMSELAEGREEMGSREYSEITEKAEKLWSDLGDVVKDQEKIADQTEAMSKEVRKRMEDRLGDKDAFVKKQVARLKSAKKKLEESRPGPFMPDLDMFELTERRLEDGIRALQGQDFGAAKEVLKKAHGQMSQLESEARRRADRARRFGEVFGAKDGSQKTEKGLKQARPQVEAVLKDIEGLTPDPASLMTPPERKQMAKLQQKQSKLQERTKKLNKDLQELGEQLPIVGPEVQDMLQQAEGAMGEAKTELGKGDAPGALGQERAALDKMRQLQQELEKMGEQGQGKPGQGVPLPFGQKPGQGKEGGNDPRGQDKVAIPQPDQYKAPAEFREDIMEAAKQGTVEAYKDAVQRYYEELVK